jgi:CheY-like chemotaxis protein
VGQEIEPGCVSRAESPVPLPEPVQTFESPLSPSPRMIEFLIVPEQSRGCFQATTKSPLIRIVRRLNQYCPVLREASAGDFMKSSTVRVLVVDDFEPWRRFVSLMLRTKQGLQVVGEASDGLEAFQKAVELEPDLVLMDIGLPTLNGLEAARRIREIVPEAKIIFLSDESSFEVVQKAMSLGASAYVVKTSAATELLTAVETVLSGLKIVSI